MTVADMDRISREMAASLSRAEFLRGRTPRSEPWFVTIRSVENLTRDVLSEGERWGIIAHVRSSLPLAELRQQKNLHFVIPIERKRAMQRDPNLGLEVEAGEVRPDFGADRRPTHALAATFRSVTRLDEHSWTELYYCEFVIEELGSGLPVWTDRVEYKRVARGHVWD